MPLYREEGVVIRAHKLGEADRIVTLLTRHRGLVRAVAKGVRRTSSRFGGRLEPFSVIDLQCYEGRNLDTITQVESIALYGAELSADFNKYGAASIMVETAERLASGEASGHQYHLLVGALRSMAKNLAPWELVRDSYILRSLGLAGWTPGLDQCVVCGKPGPHSSVMIAHGGVVCETCRVPGAIRISLEAIELLSSLLRGNWEDALRTSDGARREAAGFTAAFSQWHLERGLKSVASTKRPKDYTRRVAKGGADAESS